MIEIDKLGIKPGDKEYLRDYLKTVPDELKERMKLEHFKKNSIFVRENEEVEPVYILLEGSVRAVDFRIHGIVYDFLRFEPIKVLGAMELILGFSKYRTTLITEAECIFIGCPAKEFGDWLLNDISSIKMEMRSIGHYLLEEDRQNRMFLFLQARDRLFVLLLQYYEKHHTDDVCVVRLTRTELSDRTGISVRTINRSVKKMQEEGLIGKLNSKLTMTKEQYNKVMTYISSKID